MSKLTKNQKAVAGKVEANKLYSLAEASALVKEITTTKFDASVDVVVGHIVRLCLGDGVAKFAVGVGIGTALFYSDCDFATDFRKDISASRVAFTFFGLYVVPFAVSTHKTLLNI